MYVFNMTKAPFNDRRVRQALAMAIDREVLVEKVTRGVGVVVGRTRLPADHLVAVSSAGPLNKFWRRGRYGTL